MDLVGRDAELQRLREIAASGASLALVRGAPGAGTTTLLRELARSLGGVHLHVPDADRPQVMAALTRQLPRGVVVGGWDDLRQELEARNLAVAVLDGGLRLARDDPVALEALTAPGRPTVVLAGDDLGPAPETGVPPARQVHVGPLAYRHVRRLYPRMDEAERVRRYAVFGELPGSHLLSRFAELPDAVYDSYLAETAPLRHAVTRLLRRAGRTPTRFSSVLEALASGVHRLGDLEEAVGVGRGGLGPYLDVLRNEVHLVAREDPLLGGDRLGRYRIRDPRVAFTYRFVFPGAPELEAGRADAVWDRVRRELDAHVASVLPRVARDALEALKGTSFQGVAVAFDRIGAWWDRSGHELDLVAVGDDVVYAGETAWDPAPVDAAGLREVLARVERLDAGDRRVVPVLVARGGLAWDARREAEERGVLALDLGDVARALERVS